MPDPHHPRVRYLPTPSPRIGVTLAGTEHALSIRDAAALATAIFVVVGARGGEKVVPFVGDKVVTQNAE